MGYFSYTFLIGTVSYNLGTAHWGSNVCLLGLWRPPASFANIWKKRRWKHRAILLNFLCEWGYWAPKLYRGWSSKIITWAQFFKRWITLSTGEISIYWITQSLSWILIRWIALSNIWTTGARSQKINLQTRECFIGSLFRFLSCFKPFFPQFWFVWKLKCVHFISGNVTAGYSWTGVGRLLAAAVRPGKVGGKLISTCSLPVVVSNFLSSSQKRKVCVMPFSANHVLASQALGKELWLAVSLWALSERFWLVEMENWCHNVCGDLFKLSLAEGNWNCLHIGYLAVPCLGTGSLVKGGTALGWK